ncbi:FAD-dependent oxidoreductase [Nocardioides speluncae]|uniref:FAD-dependent oxidoreductase n=1 Tax=Nocardioides speluncae TaxID=2670337 RepID=UPI00197EE4CC|nr:NAD(P)/FAD-dependent oxidoreductase [Nocardioides speluncae]
MTKALIIGGGIAGPATAIALQKAGLEPVVFEQYAASAEGLGVFLTLGSNGIDALRTLGADRKALATGFPTPGIHLRSYTGKPLGVSRVGTELADGTTSRTMRRSDLYAALRAEAVERGLRIEGGKRLVDARPSGDGVVARFADGSEEYGDLLVGCDGLHSVVRTLIDPAAPAPSYTGLVGLGGYARGVAVDAEPGSYQMIFGRRGFFGYAVAPDDEVWWFANVPRPDEPARGEVEAIGADEWRRTLGDLFADDEGPAAELVAASEQIVTATPMHTLAHLPAWHNDRMVVLGDAAHAPSPSSGQGASLSIEDAVVLAQSLRDQPDRASALARFEALRRPRVEKIIKQAARVNSSKAATGLSRVLRDLMLPVVVRLAGNAQNWVYDFHLDWTDDGSTHAASSPST